MAFWTGTNEKRVEKIVEILDLIDKSARVNGEGGTGVATMLVPVTTRLRAMTGGVDGSLPDPVAVAEPVETPKAVQTCRWQSIRDLAEKAPLEEFPVAMAVFLNRIDEAATR